ncbi:MAG TPA: tetratricopeptide repeat protein [Blastocatellia bacterium]|nr:tetratricopeptide repeat protein [Blastocatellia bacterium]
MSQETTLLPGEQTGQTGSADVAATEVLPAPMTSSYNETEEMPITVITARAEERSTSVVANAPVTQSRPKRAKPAPAKRASGGRKRLAVAAALGVVTLAAVTFFFINSRRPPEAQAGTQPADKANPATSAQPIAQQSNQQSGQQSGAVANNQAQPQTQQQTGPATGAVKSSAVHNSEAVSNQQRQAAVKPTPATSQEMQPAGGTISAENYINQGMTYLNAGRFNEALQAFESVKKLDPGNKNVYYLIGQAYYKMNQLERALEAYRQCTSGHYASVAQSNAKTLEKKVGKVSGK